MTRTRAIGFALTALAALAALALPAVLVAGQSDADTAKAIGTPASADEPQRVTIPSIGVDSPLLRLARDQAPPPEKGMTAGWYTASAMPGRPGAAVITGHEAADGRAVFRDLRKLAAGDTIEVKRGDGKLLRFTVTATETVGRAAAFPTGKVFGTTGERALRLVTCTGDRDARGHPVRNLIVYATLRA
ncbi:sortase domain-bontaining protein [Streptomyces sp. NPDC052396]|uniref:sortase domain-containing protein n=1 Tax=Streptomyces sp. NPDC052396 TaxID=3365689 RepID=UPI0037D3E3C2